ncbi:MAG: metallophosphoesterase [Bacilli bacterium]|jgi:predicted MPP superfamily phosphohydrolase|nr:metallophosphoesterase [Bacilli bacterium]
MNRKIIISLIGSILLLIIFFIVFFTIPSHYKNKVKVADYTLNVFNTKTTIARVVVFSDTDLYYDYDINALKRAVTKINEQNPDIVIFNGDLILNSSYKENKTLNNQIISTLKELKPLYGKFAILGEQDLSNKDSQSILKSADFEILTNTVRSININNKNFNLIALYDNNKEKDVLKNVSDKTFNMVICHSPNIVDKIKDYKVDMIVVGHTLGGQYNIPLFGSIFKNIKSYPYYKGVNEVNGIKVYTSNGLGIYQSNMRFNAPSSVELFILK